MASYLDNKKVIQMWQNGFLTNEALECLLMFEFGGGE